MQTATNEKQKPHHKKPQNKWCWYIEPLDAHTNGVIARFLFQKSENATELRDSEGHLRKVWECAPDEAANLRQSAKAERLKLNIYMKYNGNPLELCNSPQKKFAKRRRRR